MSKFDVRCDDGSLKEGMGDAGQQESIKSSHVGVEPNEGDAASSFALEGNGNGRAATNGDEVINELVCTEGRERDLVEEERANVRESVGKINSREMYKVRDVQVTNLSDKVLSTDHLSLLSKGLGFVPVRTPKTTRLISELKEWERLMRLREYWADSTVRRGTNESEESSHRGKSTRAYDDLKYKKSHWTPERGRERCATRLRHEARAPTCTRQREAR